MQRRHPWMQQDADSKASVHYYIYDENYLLAYIVFSTMKIQR